MLRYIIPLALAATTASAEITMNIEEPTNGAVYNGIKNIRGWAVSDVPVKSVYIYHNGVSKGLMPYGGARRDVQRNYPDTPGSLNSGFSSTWNYSIMEDGNNSMKVVVTDENGGTKEQTVNFVVEAFDNGYMQPSDINLGTTLERVDNQSFNIDGSLIDGVETNMSFTWDVPSQSFAIDSIISRDLKDNVTYTSVFKPESIVEINKMRTTGRNCGSTFYPAVTPATWHPILAQTSLEHSIDMVINNFFSHTGSDGSSPWSRAGANGYTAAGEVIAAGSGTIEGAFSQWNDSPGHCAIIMSPSIHEFGLGMAQGTGTTYGTYWTMLVN